MSLFSRPCAVALVLFSLFAGRVGDTGGVHAERRTGPAIWHPSTVALSLLGWINADRVAHHTGTVRLDYAQSPCSYGWSVHMAHAGMLSHGRPNDICVSAAWSGEAVGDIVVLPDRVGGSKYSRLVRAYDLYRAMIDESPCPTVPCGAGEWEQHGHYYVMIDPKWQSVGIAVYYGKSRLWLTLDFTAIAGP